MSIENIIIFILIAFLFYLIDKIRKERIKADLYLRDELMSIFWALKEKNILSMKDIKEGKKVSKGEKTPPLSLIEWGNLFNDEKDNSDKKVIHSQN